ncbi:MAG: Na/Pi cotransporter family protein [Saprospiraceae bacterium]|nr:Na/Pi cotransporter family protein [Saprospiraceae bacterium]
MDFGFSDVIQIVGSLAFFVYGMKMMSDGIQRAAGSQLRKILRTMTKNRYLGVFTGFLTTALVQSSSATTVMTVSFVNAGLLSLVESAGVMMGANIGTTITGWIVSFLGFKVKLHHLSIPLFAIAVPMLFSKRGKFKYWGEFLIGFAILFLGLSYLKGAVPDIKGNTEVLAWIQNFADYGFISRVFFVFVGALVTVLVQSSSAAMAITLTLVYTGWLPLDVAAAMILGENIGTTITAEIASLVGNVHAKRSARIHSMFNIIGVTWMIILLPVVIQYLGGFVESFSDVFEKGIKTKDDLDSINTLNTYKLAAFHTCFNLLNVLLLLPFVPFLVKAAIWSVKSKNEDDEDIRLTFIKGSSRTPELATVELQKETAHFGEVVSRISGFMRILVNTTKNKIREDMYKKMAKYENITDEMEREVTEYITALGNDEITPKTSIRLRSILNIANDLERIGDVYYQISKTIESKNENKIYFTQTQRKNLNEYMDLIDSAFKEMLNNLETSSYDDVSISKANDLETDINRFRDKLRKENLSNLGKKDYNVNSAMIYNNLFSSLEKVGDHIINVSESIVGEI